MTTKLASSLVSRDQALSTSLVSGKQENRDTVDMVRGGTEVVLVGTEQSSREDRSYVLKRGRRRGKNRVKEEREEGYISGVGVKVRHSNRR